MKSVRLLAMTALTTAALGGCGDGTGVGGPSNLTLGFQVSSGVPALGAPSAAAGPPLVLGGTNGTLTIDEIRLIVSEVELKKDEDDACADDDHEHDDVGDSCEKFNAGPRFIDLPLDGQPIEVTTDLVPAGVYDELEFEIEDLEDDEDDAAEAALVAAVRAEVLAAIPDWPEEASALIVGSFTPTSGTPVEFRVFLEAEIEVEMDLAPNLVIDGGTASRDVTVDVEPHIWFTQPDGTVLDLSQFDFDAAGETLEFEVEMEHGFTKIEVED